MEETKSKSRVPKWCKEGEPDWDAQYNMLLADGKTCNDCGHVKRCSMLFGQDEEATTCQWHPNKYAPQD